ncbi:MAG: SHOCT domain-containing protein [Bdellovibrionales bacterium]|nr:SHOCT domain-containing protein [Bdellovibrionales bacterium]
MNANTYGINLWVGWLAMAIGIAVVIYLVSRAERDYTQKVSAEDILKKRLARGEINKDEYRALKNMLTQN